MSKHEVGSTAGASEARDDALEWSEGQLAAEAVTLWLDSDVIAAFHANGPGWQGRINAALRVATGL